MEKLLSDENVLDLAVDDFDLPPVSHHYPDRKKLWSMLKQSYKMICALSTTTQSESPNTVYELEKTIKNVLTPDFMKGVLKDALETTPNSMNSMNYAAVATAAINKPTTAAHLTLPSGAFELPVTNKLLKTMPTTFKNKNDDGSVLLGFETRELMMKARDTIAESNPDVTMVEKVKMQKLTIRNADVSTIQGKAEKEEKMSKEEREDNDAHVIEMLKEKNVEVKNMLNEGESVEVIYFKRHFRDNDLATIAIRATKKLYDYMLSRGYVFMGNSYSRVEKRVYIKQCYHCQAHGHVSSECTVSTGPTCYHCAGSHESRTCVNKKTQSCSNCLKSTNPHFSSGATTHNAASQLCPIYQKLIQASKNY